MVPNGSGDGLSALLQLRAASAVGAPYRLALLDMCMADMDGIELARRISTDPEHASTGLLLLTSASGVDPEEARRAGIANLLVKPVRQSQLYDALVDLVAPRTAGDGDHHAGSARLGDETRGHVLVVEDNATNQLVAVGILSQLRWTADVVGNGKEAIEAVTRGRYAAVLMDCQMPVMDGYTATAEIRRAEGHGRRVPIIAMTASAVAGDRERCLGAGMDDHIAKPVTPELVEAALDRWTGAADRVVAVPAAETPGIAETAVNAVDQQRLDMLRGMGPPDGSLFARIVEAFLTSASVDLPALREAVAHGEGVAVQAIAHRLRGSAANIGAASLARLCAELEAAGGSGDLSSAADLLCRAEAEMLAVGAELRAACAEGPATK